MTKKTKLVVSRRLWHGGKFIEPGTALADIEPAPTEAELKLYTDEAAPFLEDQDVIEERRNGEAYRARKQVEAVGGDLRSLYAALGDDITTTEDALDTIQDLQAAANRASDNAAGQVFESSLRALYPDAKDTEGLLQAARDTQARVATLEKLHAAPAGTDLPSNFIGRGKLAAFGLTTFESLRGKTAQQLDAIEGLTAEQAGKIVEAVEKHFSTPVE